MYASALNLNLNSPVRILNDFLNIYINNCKKPSNKIMLNSLLNCRTAIQQMKWNACINV